PLPQPAPLAGPRNSRRQARPPHHRHLPPRRGGMARAPAGRRRAVGRRSGRARAIERPGRAYPGLRPERLSPGVHRAAVQARRVTPDLFTIVEGRRADHDALARFHYRAGPPATCVRVLSAADRQTGELIGVLTVSMPTLNAPWRSEAWPDLGGGD